MKKVNKPKISYDKESRVLSLELKRAKSADSDIRGNVVVDYDKKGWIVRIDIYDFNFEDFRENRKTLKEFSEIGNIPFAVK